MKKTKNDNQGFTMIELIVTITILAVMAAFTAPSLLGFVDDAKAKECRSKVTDIKRLYSEEAVDMGVDTPSGYENFNLVDSAVQKSGGAYSDGTTFPELSDEDREKKPDDKYQFYAGLCPRGGEYVISFDRDADVGDAEGVKNKILIACTYPGHTEQKVSNSLIGLHTLAKAINDSTSKIYKFYVTDKKTGHLDSTGKIYAPEVQNMLAAIGIDISSSSSWQIVKLNRQEANPNKPEEEWGYNIYWTEEKIDGYDPGTPISVIKYNTGTKKYYYGTGKVKWHENYPDPEYCFVIMDFTGTEWEETTRV